MGVMIPSDPWLSYRSAQLPLFRMIFPWVLAHMGVGSTSCLPSLHLAVHLAAAARAGLAFGIAVVKAFAGG